VSRFSRSSRKGEWVYLLCRAPHIHPPPASNHPDAHMLLRARLLPLQVMVPAKEVRTQERTSAFPKATARCTVLTIRKRSPFKCSTGQSGRPSVSNNATKIANPPALLDAALTRVKTITTKATAVSTGQRSRDLLKGSSLCHTFL